MDQLVNAHAHAYAWSPTTDATQLLDRVLELLPHPDTKLRTRVRTGIHWLDHLFQYGEDPAMGFNGLSEEDPTREEETPDDDAAAEE